MPNPRFQGESLFHIAQISPERARVLSDEIAANSEPAWRFYALLITSSMIACFGLAANSTAVIIGAMLVSPLMTPIFGIALGMLRGDVGLMGRAARAEVGGVLLAIGSACLIGLSPLFSGEATPEMLSRTQPNLIDLLVAIFAGFAGSYAVVDERISPALPGVAIATAIVPPLSTCGLCLSLGAWRASAGSLLLFLANCVSILIVALLTFGLTGLAQSNDARTWRAWRRRFAPTAIVFVLMAWVLTQSLVQITTDRRISLGIRERLLEEFADDMAVELDDFDYNLQKGRVELLVNVRAPRIVQPSRVTKLKQAIANEIDFPVDLVVRTTLAKDVSAYGSEVHVQQPDINGAFLTRNIDGHAVKEVLAAQVIREYFESASGFDLTNVEYGVGTHGRAIVLAYIDALTPPTRKMIRELETRMQDRLEEQNLGLAIRLNQAEIRTSHGPIMVEWSDWRHSSPEEYARFPELEREVQLVVANAIDAIPSHVHFQYGHDMLNMMIELSGPKTVTKEDAKLVEERVRQLLGRPVRVNLWYRNEFVVNSDDYTTVDAVTRADIREREQALQSIFSTIRNDSLDQTPKQ